MCSNCFDTGVETFSSPKTFEDFEKQLEQRLRAPEGLFYLRQSPPGELIAYTIYGCRSCDAKWYLNIPISENSGCFLESEKFLPLLEKVKKNDSRSRTGVIIFCLVIMFFCLWFLLTQT